MPTNLEKDFKHMGSEEARATCEEYAGHGFEINVKVVICAWIEMLEIDRYHLGGINI